MEYIGQFKGIKVYYGTIDDYRALGQAERDNGCYTIVMHGDKGYALRYGKVVGSVNEDMNEMKLWDAKKNVDDVFGVERHVALAQEEVLSERVAYQALAEDGHDALAAVVRQGKKVRKKVIENNKSEEEPVED